MESQQDHVAVVMLLLLLRYDAGMTGIGLVPASVLHVALAAVWCIACLRTTWWQAGGR